ncbi:Uma2 family endonuclease [Lentzea sp. NPDC059081]|uniref:Uma2 family endonuclease n=1 Tax=Lentzea sp. NPDC059081 TaxID=3346719 RepID=UPI003688658A
MITTLDAYDAMAEDECRRYELVHGVLVEMPPRTPHHQRALMAFTHQLDGQLPSELDVVHSFDVVLADRGCPLMRKPDVVVASSRAFRDDVTRFAAEDVVLVVEIMSEESGRVDSVTKPKEYAEAGIAHYWLVELGDPISLTAFELVDGIYKLVGDCVGEVQLTRPAPLTFDLDALTRRR